MNIFSRLFFFLVLALLVGGTWPIVDVHAIEQAACCLCHLKSDQNNFCVKDIPKEDGAFRGCTSFLTDLKAGREMSTTYPQVDNVVCEKTLTPEQCKTLSASGVCPAAPVPFSNLPGKAGITGAQTIQSLDQQSVTPTLGVAIPGLSFGSITREGGYIRIPFLGQYIAAAFRYALGIVVICAIVMIVYGGFRYLIGSAAGSVKRGKTIIVDAIAGLIITLGAFLILNTINPATLSLDAVKIPYIQLVEFDMGDIMTGSFSVNSCTEQQYICHTGDECEKICGQSPSAWPKCSPSIADTSAVKRVPNSTGIDNPGGQSVLPDLLEPIRQAGIIARRINPNYRIVISSGHRKLESQVQGVCKLIKSGKTNRIGTSVAWPGGSNHGAGRAIDIQLWEGNRKLVCSDCFEDQRHESYRQGAQTLAKIMEEVGFVRYTKEIWHFELGTNNESRCSGDACPFPPPK